MRLIITLLLALSTLFAGTTGIASANNIDLTNISLEDKDTGNDTYDIEFDLSWENSWRAAGAPSLSANWDAAWLFAKFSVKSAGVWGDWTHCTLLNTGAVAAAGSTVSFADNESDGVYRGAFAYRDSAGSGAIDWDNMQIRWAYGTDGVSDSAIVKIKLFAIEMAYIPEGQFYVGDADNDQERCFFESDGSFQEDEAGLGPYRITSEGAITVGEGVGNLDYDQDGDASRAGDRTGPIPAAFPKGYNDFYIMKYEVSQSQYSEFLNTLTTVQQNRRHDAALHFNVNRNFIKKTASSPAVFGCDAGNDAGADADAVKTELNESDDGEWTACNYLSWMDIAAYADWAALRPFTELEFEKAARGGQSVFDDEYAWGNSGIAGSAYTLGGEKTDSEIVTNSAADPAGNASYSTTDGALDGPLRCGVFADNDSTRAEAGGSYYGVMELSGNVWEKPVTVGNATGRSFTGTHGDGVLTTTTSYEGNATNTDWPGIHATPANGVHDSAAGSGFRGGTWSDGASNSRVSARYSAAIAHTTRYSGNGARCSRTSP